MSPLEGYAFASWKTNHSDFATHHHVHLMECSYYLDNDAGYLSQRAILDGASKEVFKSSELAHLTAIVTWCSSHIMSML